MSKNNEITVTSNAGYLALKDFDLNEVMAEEMSGLSASFERIKIPSGGGTVFEIPGDDPDEPETVKDVLEPELTYTPPPVPLLSVILPPLIVNVPPAEAEKSWYPYEPPTNTPPPSLAVLPLISPPLIWKLP